MILSDIDNETLAALSDMFGIRAYGIDTKYFTPSDKNTIGATFSGLFLWNRIVWIAVGFIILFLSYFITTVMLLISVAVILPFKTIFGLFVNANSEI